MIDLGPHAVFIASAYLGVLAVIALLIIWTILNARRQKARLRELEQRGVRRRSEKTATLDSGKGRE